ncbi:MAG: aldose epimerase family protein [Verrucomicrobiota bacterium]
MRTLVIFSALIAMSALSTSANDPGGPVSVVESLHGKMPDGQNVTLFTLTNASGMVAKVTEYGAILDSITAPDRDGNFADVTHGYDTLEGWLTNTSYFGATVGRFGNRIANGKFTLDGQEYTLATNNDPGGVPCHLHGGIKGFDKVLWSGEAMEGEGSRGVKLVYRSVDGEEGYPGNLNVEVTYTLTDDNELIWEAKATTDAPTVVNLVHHSYWNLSGDPRTSINDHELTLHAENYLPTNPGLIPTGELKAVKDTPMDFTTSHLIGARVDEAYESLKLGGGYDHAWVLSGETVDNMKLAARLKDPETGRVMTIKTDQPAIQFYGGNFLDGTVAGKGGVAYEYRTALCLETENFPDAPNNPQAPSAELRPGEVYSHRMVHTFSAE